MLMMRSKQNSLIQAYSYLFSWSFNLINTSCWKRKCICKKFGSDIEFWWHSWH